MKIPKNQLSLDRKVKIVAQAIESTKLMREKQLEILNLNLTKAENEKNAIMQSLSERQAQIDDKVS